MRALVTGGAGFIGSHLVDRLLADRWVVDIVDTFWTGCWENIVLAYRHSGFDLFNGPVYDNSPWQNEAAQKADVIFHLAATVGVDRVQKEPKLAVGGNLHATQHALELAFRYKKPILIASSSEVYGHRADDAPLREDMDLHISPELRWGYAAAKLADEFTALAHHAESGLPVVVARIFNTVGPRQVGTYGMVMPRMIDAALTGQPITVIGGAQRRSFAWVTETVDCLVRLIQTTAAYGQVVNVGSQNDISMRTLAVFIQRAAAKHHIHQPPVDFQPYRKDWNDILYRMPDLTKLQSLIGVVPNKPILDMIDELVAAKIDSLTGTVR